MPLLDTNVAEGLPRGSPFQVGRADHDNDTTFERGIFLPRMPAPAASYMYYDCTVGAVLDSGIVVHNRLPQTISPISDTLAVIPFDDPRLGGATDFGYGVNRTCRDQYRDIVQRMGHARYWFRLWGQALRIGYQVPIPGIRTIGGVAAIPYDKNPQWAYNRIFPGGNYSGAILWHAQWSLWYTTLVPPGQTGAGERHLVADPAARISGHAGSVPPTGIQVPYSQADDNAHP